MTNPIKVERRVAAPPETVFEYIIDPSLRSMWLGVSSQLGTEPGQRFEMHAPNGMVASGEMVGVTARKVSFTWGWDGHPDVPKGSTIVEIELFPDGDGTLVRLTHSGLAANDTPMHLKGWNHYLARMSMAVDGGDPGPDPGAG